MMTKLHVLRRRDNERTLATWLTGSVGGVCVSVCLGEVSDVFRTSRYGEVIHPLLPPGRASDAEFEEFLRRARSAGDDEFADLLAGAVA